MLFLCSHKNPAACLPLPLTLCSSLNPAAVSQGQKGQVLFPSRALTDLAIQDAKHKDHPENHPQNEVSLKLKLRNFILESSQILRPEPFRAQEEGGQFAL